MRIESMKKWKALAYLFSVFFIVNLVALSISDNLSIWDFLNSVVIGLSLVPLYGYAWQKAIGNKLTSIFIFIFNLSCTLFALIYIGFEFLNSLGSFITYSITYILLILFLYPQYCYAFKSEKLWLKNT
ncbi:hypothetical protein AAD001_14890 [Colwelliaceae bacterium 6471]